MTPRRGFTLLEVTIVLMIIVILGAMAWPSIDAMYADVRLSAAADQLRARWAEARTQAIEEGRPYRFGIQADGGQYRIAPDNDFLSEGGTAGDSDTPPLVVEESLPKGINFADSGIAQNSDSAGDNSGPWQSIVKFLPDGTASADVEIVFQAEGSARPLQLKLRGLTGSVSQQWLEPGSRRGGGQ